jgi:hypothetical protein
MVMSPLKCRCAQSVTMCLEFRIQELWFRVKGLGFPIKGKRLGYRVKDV